MNCNQSVLMMILFLLFQIEVIFSASSGSENEFNIDDFNWFKDEHHSLVSPEEMRLPPTIHHVTSHDHLTLDHGHLHQQQQQQRQQADNNKEVHHIHELLQKELEHARKTGVGSLLVSGERERDQIGLSVLKADFDCINSS